MKVAVRIALAIIALAAAEAALAQEFEATKFPVSGATLGPTGQFVADAGATVRWRVVLNNPFPLPLGQNVELDFLDVVGGDSCGGFGQPGLDCMSSSLLTLLCPTDPMDPNYPDGGGFTFDCDDANNRFAVNRVLVEAGTCVQFEFSTVVSEMAGGLVGNSGCLNVSSPAPQIAATAPADTTAPGWPWSCANPPTPEAMPNCSTIFVAQLPDFEFEAIKTAEHVDADGNGLIDVGETLNWTVTMTDTSTDAMDVTGFLFDTIQANQDFGAIITDPGGCLFDAGRGEIACDPLTFADGEVKVLQFSTTVNCNAIQDTDTVQICNQAEICGDETRLSCVPSDDDGVINGTPDPTCLGYSQPDFSNSEKTWTWTDNDGDGALSNGDTVDFQVLVTNDGSRDATEVTVTDDLNPSIDPVTGCLDEASISVGDGGSYDAGTGIITWLLAAPLAPGESATVGFTVNVTENPPCCNQAFVNSAERTTACPDVPGIPTDDVSTMAGDDPTCLIFGPQPNIVVEKDFTESVADGEVMVGEEITFEVTVRNDGAGPATGVALNDPVLSCFNSCGPVMIVGDGVDNSTGPGMGTACTINVSEIGGADGLLPGEEVVISWTVVVEATSCCNRAVVSYDQSAASIGSTDPVTGADRTCMDRGESDCANGVDDDGDGFIDCDDPDCATDPACAGTENCANGVDDDGDGNVDCELGNEDADCPCGEEADAQGNCDDGVDNDGDGLTDLDDPDCNPPEDCTNGLDDDGDGLVDCQPGVEDDDCPCGEESEAAMNCDDGVDNDGDGLTDLDDPDCGVPEDCTNGVDDDGDGMVDCQMGNEDPDCPCGPETQGDGNCNDGVDNDGDGLTDVDDPGCASEDCTNGVDDDGDGNVDCEPGNEDADCPCGEESDAAMNCDDGVDNDGDGRTDVDDPDCTGAVEDCVNGTDDDGDGDVDCADTDCADSPDCSGADTDGDGVINSEDCAPTDPEVWAVPGPVTGLDFQIDPAGSGGVLLTWDCQSAEAGPGTVYDVVWGLLDELIAAGGDTVDAQCAADDVVDMSPDCRPSYLDEPRTGNLYYMVRAQNSCGDGGYGTDSMGNERTVGAGDCP